MRKVHHPTLHISKRNIYGPVDIGAARAIVDFERFVGIGFYNFLVDLTQQFASASFGHPLFARFLFLFLHSSYPAEYRKAVWNGIQDTPQILALPDNEEPLFGIEG